MAEPSIGATVAKVAKELVPAPNQSTAASGGECWEFVHKVLYESNAKSYYDINPNYKGDKVFAPWGESINGPEVGALVVIKDAKWTTQETEEVGRGTVKTKRQVSRPHQFHKHVAVVVAIEKTHIRIANSGVPNRKAAPSMLWIPHRNLGGQSVVKYFRPIALPKGQKASNPTPKAKKAAGVK